jgi:hypothetical protein
MAPTDPMFAPGRSKFDAVRKIRAMPLTSIGFPFVIATISDKEHQTRVVASIQDSAGHRAAS